VSDIPKEILMGIILAVLLLALIFAGASFALHVLWILAAVLIVAWLAGFAFHGSGNTRWYRW
jgi:hypothetical protein